MDTTKNQTNDIIFAKGEKASADYFTGEVWVNIMLTKDQNDFYSIADVKFQPRARTHWHTHPAGQVLLVTEGKGYYQEKGKPAQSLAKGDVYEIPANIEHWHGAASDRRFVHIALTNYKNGEVVEWLNPVTDEEYKSAIK